MEGTVKNSVLIVDDNTDSIKMLEFILKNDYVLHAAKSGEEAIELAQKYVPDIILLDVLMPKMDGYEVLIRLKEIPETKNIPVIFVTGLTEADDEAKGLSLGAADYITKPFSSAIVKLRVEKQLKMGNLEKEYNEAISKMNG